ncbi:MAG: hypothetical protein GX061_06325 [Eubacteriaceae bacterium]|nr:hypothetical protein [Eubacteriaceae bacterium]
MKRFKTFLIFMMVITLLYGCGEKEAPQSEGVLFETEEFSIRLPEEYIKEDLAGVRAYFKGENSLLAVYRESYEELAAINITKRSTLREYAQIVLSVNGLSAQELKEREGAGYYYISYTAAAEGIDYLYLAVLQKNSEGFYIFTFAGVKSMEQRWEEEFFEAADSIVMK